MSEGRDLILNVSNDGTNVIGTAIPVENQGDTTVNGGKSVSPTVYKNGQTVSQNDAGKTVTLTMGLTAPVGTAQGLLLDLDDSGDSSFFWLINARTGGIEWEFEGKVGVGTINSPVNGDSSAQVTIGIVGDWTRGAAT